MLIKNTLMQSAWQPWYARLAGTKYIVTYFIPAAPATAHTQLPTTIERRFNSGRPHHLWLSLSKLIPPHDDQRRTTNDDACWGKKDAKPTLVLSSHEYKTPSKTPLPPKTTTNRKTGNTKAKTTQRLDPYGKKTHLETTENTTTQQLCSASSFLCQEMHFIVLPLSLEELS